MRDMNRLLIISVPFMRIARNSLSKIILQLSKKNTDILVVSPFSDESGFKRNFDQTGVYFIKWSEENISPIKKTLLKIPDLMRRLGHWRRHKDQEMKYYFKTQYNVLGPDGNDKRMSIPQTIIYFLLSILGQYKGCWRFTEFLLGRGWYKFPALVAFCKPYEHITLLQSANWGLQDRCLARISLKEQWRKVLLPYTTDQLFGNGFLINHFDAICVQGQFELEQAEKLHDIPDNKLFRLGSAWFRHIEQIKTDINRNNDCSAGCIVYAGVLNIYFPTNSEFIAIDALIEFIKSSNLNYYIIYRPVAFDKTIKVLVEQKYGDLDIVKIRWPESSVIGLDKYHDADHYKSLQEYVRELVNCNLLVMSKTTSYCLDASFVSQCGVISNMIDSGGVLQRRPHNNRVTYI